MPQINLTSNNRILITGKTGSGKTYLAKHITRNIPRLVVLDGKGTLKDWNLEPWNPETVSKLKTGEPVRIRAVAPVSGILEYWEYVLTVCYYSRNLTIYIDELYAVVPPNNKPMEILWANYTRGRELGIGIWASTQRPVWIPLFALSESEHFFMFRLSLLDDRQRMAAFCGREVIRDIKDEHGFFYSFANWDKPIYIKRLAGDDIVKITPKEETETPEISRKERRKLRFLQRT